MIDEKFITSLGSIINGTTGKNSSMTFIGFIHKFRS